MSGSPVYKFNLNLRTKPKPVFATAAVVLFLLFLVKRSPTNGPHLHAHHVRLAHDACQGMPYPKLCVSALCSSRDIATAPLRKIISVFLNKSMSEVLTSSSKCQAIENSLASLSVMEAHAFSDCFELFQDTMEELKTVLLDFVAGKKATRRFDDLTTWLSAAMTNLYTCLDGFALCNQNVRLKIDDSGVDVGSGHLANALSVLKKIRKVSKADSPEHHPAEDGFPAWVSSGDRKLLQANDNDSKNCSSYVAKDGSGNYTTIRDAVAAAPKKLTSGRHVICIAAGTYEEYVEVNKSRTNLMFIGEGINKTVVTGKRSVGDGWTTFKSATVAVMGARFLAKGLTIRNTAGPQKHQAVALRTDSDLSAFHKCSFEGYQDTLYVHSLRTFFRECDIYGTVDFIFGNAAAVFQNCNIYARRPLDNQKIMVTAQGRTDPNQNTGISVINCTVAAAADLEPALANFSAFLGRPWKHFAVTAFMFSRLDALINAKGWSEWDNTTSTLTTIEYREYMNTGPGSNTSGRVDWPGFKVLKSDSEAQKFTAGEFIQAKDWLSGTGIPFYSGLRP